MLVDLISKYSKFAFYGAQVVAYGAYSAISYLCKRTPECFIVSNPEGNPNEIDGIPVTLLDAVPTDTLIIIAVTELLQNEIVLALQSRGYTHTFRLTAHEEHLLMSAYYGGIELFPLATKEPDRKNDLALYEVRHHLDKPLHNHPALKSWEKPIQAGAELTDKCICEQLDNIGVNISAKNKQYCEASVMYWVWKNAKAPWVGIEHYRRHLLVSPDMLNESVDAILPLPYICYPNTQAQFTRFVGEEVVTLLLSALKMLYPDEYSVYVRCLQGKYHYAYNLIAAQLPVFSDYCQWAFRITNHIESLGIEKISNSRALAYIMEQLTSIYFISNKKRLTIKHAERAIYT